MRELRLELRWPPDDPVGQLLTQLPRGMRNRVVQAILNAALLPGGWARLVDGQVRVTTPVTADPPPDPGPAPVDPPALADTGMSAAGAQRFVDSLRAFGALDL